MSDVNQIAWDAIPDAFRIHCRLEVHGLGFQDVVFQEDHSGTGNWESTFMPPDGFGPAHVVYFPDCVEVWRYQAADSGNVELTATFKWEDPDLLDRVISAATIDMLKEEAKA